MSGLERMQWADGTGDTVMLDKGIAGRYPQMTIWCEDANDGDAVMVDLDPHQVTEMRDWMNDWLERYG